MHHLRRRYSLFSTSPPPVRVHALPHPEPLTLHYLPSQTSSGVRVWTFSVVIERWAAPRKPPASVLPPTRALTLRAPSGILGFLHPRKLATQWEVRTKSKVPGGKFWVVSSSFFLTCGPCLHCLPSQCLPALCPHLHSGQVALVSSC